MKKILLAILILSNLNDIFSQSLPGDVIQNIKNSTVYIKVNHIFPLTGDEVPTSGTGFFINESGYIVTNYHVIEPVFSIYGLSFPAPVSNIRVICNSGSEKHKAFNAYIITLDKDNDLAILGISDSAKTPFLDIEYKEKVVETMPVWVFGYPFGDEFTVIQRGPEITISKGFVSALRHDDRGEFKRIQIDAAVNPGNSGGPVINEKGKVIGVVKMAYGESRVNFVVPCHFLNTIMNKIPLDSSISDSATITIKSNPASVSFFLDGHPENINDPKKLKINQGWHTFCGMKQNYETWMDEKAVFGTNKIAMSLKPEKNLSICVGEKKPNEDYKSNLSCLDKAIKELTHRNFPDTKEMLLCEDFNDPAAFQQWEQYTGGTDKRTWFIENSALHQFESNKTLHAIYLGDTTWDNYIISAKVKITDRHDDSRAGLIFRETPDGFYLFRIHKETKKAQLAYHCKHPFGWFILREKKLNLEITDKWYNMSVIVSGNKITCLLNNRCVFSTTAQYANCGRVGFYSVESKASFDSLFIYKAKSQDSEISQAHKPELLSFWFSDYFNNESTWWYQYTVGDKRPKPWFFSDGGCSQPSSNDTKKCLEFTKYLLKDFTMELLVSLGKGDKYSLFEIFFRKNDNCCIKLRFSEKDKKIKLVYVQGNNEKVLEKKSMSPNIYNNTLQFRLIISKEKVICRTTEETLLECRNKKIDLNEGRFGFTAFHVPVVFHQMTVSSVPEEYISSITR